MSANSPWKTLGQAAERVPLHNGRPIGKRFLAKEVREGRLRAARIGGNGQLLTRDEWVDEWITDHATPVPVSMRRRA